MRCFRLAAWDAVGVAGVVVCIACCHRFLLPDFVASESLWVCCIVGSSSVAVSLLKLQLLRVGAKLFTKPWQRRTSPKPHWHAFGVSVWSETHGALACCVFECQRVLSRSEASTLLPLTTSVALALPLGVLAMATGILVRAMTPASCEKEAMLL